MADFNSSARYKIIYDFRTFFIATNLNLQF